MTEALERQLKSMLEEINIPVNKTVSSYYSSISWLENKDDRYYTLTVNPVSRFQPVEYYVIEVREDRGVLIGGSYIKTYSSAFEYYEYVLHWLNTYKKDYHTESQ